MVLPEGNHAAQQVGATQKGTLRHRRATNNNVAAAASGYVSAIESKLFGCEPVLAGFLKENHMQGFELIPIACRREIDL